MMGPFLQQILGSMTGFIIAHLIIYAIEKLGKRKEVIRCKDCKYNNGGRCGWHGGAGYKWVVDDDDYCSCGEGRTE